ncbi:hypothetical protein LWI29_032760 [Acer saccharum]|uniref:Pectinesterase inhibitor domain-containing protein n=1 Tax=Acer saccharum TaxID=4024 RepID=A0AA39W3D8_ACESA|nr:hypothetical protein LWI29_032760 [Acer saccharum]
MDITKYSSFVVLSLLIIYLLSNQRWVLVSGEGNDLIDSTCKTTDDPNLCMKILRSDPHSSCADVKGLAHIMLEAASAYCNETSGQIKKMLNETKISDRPVDKFMRDCLRLCLEEYNIGVNNIQDAIQRLELNDYYKGIIDTQASVNGAITCEEGFSQSPVKLKSPLTDRYYHFDKLCEISMDILTELR